MLKENPPCSYNFAHALVSVALRKYEARVLGYGTTWQFVAWCQGILMLPQKEPSTTPRRAR